MNNDSIGAIKQRLEILYQFVEGLEISGGGSGGSYSKKETDTLLAAKANKNDLTSLTGRFEDLFALDDITIETNETYPSSIDKLLRLHFPISLNHCNYYFQDESGIDYIYFAVDTSGAYPKISFVRLLKEGHKVIFYDFVVDTVPRENSDNFITSGGVYSAIKSLENRIAALERGES